MNSDERGIPDNSVPLETAREARCGIPPTVGVTEERFQDGMYRQLVGDVATAATMSQSGRNETMAIQIDPTTQGDFDELVADMVDKNKAPGVVIFFPHGVLNYTLASFVNQNAYTYSTGGQYNDGNLMRIVGRKGQSARELTDQVREAGFIPFDELPNVRYCFSGLNYEQEFNLKMIVKLLDASIWVDSIEGVKTHCVTFTTAYQLKGFMSFTEEAELGELAVSTSRWDK